jgi:hypothetical protein
MGAAVDAAMIFKSEKSFGPDAAKRREMSS